MENSNIYDYMHNLPIEGYQRGVDALTITSTGLEGKMSVDLVLHSLEDYIATQQVKTFRFQGAEGKAWGSARYATKWDKGKRQLWAILMITGEQSKEALREALKVKDVKVTRVDLCVDVFMSEVVEKLARKLYDTYKGKSEVKLVESLTGDTFYCGSRQSESMVRIYDKSAEYGEERGRVWRFEVEIKKELANLTVQTLEKEGQRVIGELVWSTMRDKGLPTPAIPDKVRIERSSTGIITHERKIAWLSRQVRPTVDYLKRIGKEAEAREALQLGFQDY